MCSSVEISELVLTLCVNRLQVYWPILRQAQRIWSIQGKKKPPYTPVKVWLRKRTGGVKIENSMPVHTHMLSEIFQFLQW